VNEPILLLVDYARDDHFPGDATFWTWASVAKIGRSDCIVWTLQDLDAQRPMPEVKLVLCLGRAAFVAFTGIRKAIDDARGYFFKPEDRQPVKVKVREQIGVYKTNRPNAKKGDPRYGNVTREIYPPEPPGMYWIIGTLHPESDVQDRGFTTVPAMIADLRRAHRVIQPDFVPPHRPAYITAAPAEWDMPTPGTPVALDIETQGFHGAIERIGFSYRKDGKLKTFTAPWPIAKTREATREIVKSASVVIGHNLATFDLPKLALDHIETPAQIFDTMYAAHMIQPDLYKSLERSASLYLDLYAWKHKFESAPEEYNATDVAVTYCMYEKQLAALEFMGMRQLVETTIMPGLPVLMRLSERGLKVHKPSLEEWTKQLDHDYVTATKEWEAIAPGVNPDSPAQVKRFITDILGVYTTSVSVEALAYVRKDYPEYNAILDKLLAVKRLNKMLGTYASIDITLDGCVHPKYLPATKDSERGDERKGAAATGRLAASDPPIQQQPKAARKMYVPHYPDWIFAELDYSQIEARIAAALSQDYRLLEALKGDVHATNMRILNCDRVRAKNVLYGTLYGGGPRKLAKVLQSHGFSTTEAECKDLQNRLAAAYPDLWRWRQRISGEGITKLYLTNAFGRRRYFYGRTGDVPKMLDYMPQSCAADILWRLLVPLEGEVEAAGGLFVTTVHDSILVEAPPDKLGRVVETVRSLMGQEFPEIAPGFTVPVDVKVGPTWGSLEEHRS